MWKITELSSDRPTPETDEQINGKPCTRFQIAAGDSLRDAWVPSEFARKLQRERDEAREELCHLRACVFDALSALEAGAFDELKKAWKEAAK